MKTNELALPDTAGTQWPQAVEILNEDGRSPIVLICEHASNYIPPEYAGLGLDHEELQRHIAWDIGAAQVTRSLSRRLDAPAFLGTYSRLLIDLNRPPHVSASVPVRSEATDIPGNHSLSAAERERRVRMIFTPFQAAVAAHMERRKLAGRDRILIAMHSFTPVYLGTTRPWHVGVLFGKAGDLAQAIISRLQREPELNVGGNVPYSVSADDDFALLEYGDNVGNPAVLIETRHDLIANTANADRWADRYATVLSDAVSSLGAGGDRA
jgi:predicted N-formylglutamate amidohydrolase